MGAAVIQSPSISPPLFKDTLFGPNAFYKNQEQYLAETKNDFAKTEPLPPIYTTNTANWKPESNSYRIAKKILEIALAIIFIPYGIYKLLELIARCAVLPSVLIFQTASYRNECDLDQQELICGLLNLPIFKYKRITVETDGIKVDATLLINPKGKQDRWVLYSNGNGEVTESIVASPSNFFKETVSQLNGNAIIFNYPGVGSSTEPPYSDFLAKDYKKAMIKAYKAMLRFLEDDKDGIGAKEIVGFGHSMGGGVQGEALKDHELKSDKRYVFVKSQTYSNLGDLVTELISKVARFILEHFGWSFDSVESSKNLQAPELILQRTNVTKREIEEGGGYPQITDPNRIVSDGLITANGSLAKTLLKDPSLKHVFEKDYRGKNRKVVLGVREKHSQGYFDIYSYVSVMNEMLAQQSAG